MPNHDLGAEVGEPGTETTDRLRRQGDFGDQEDSGAAFGDDLTDQGHVDFRLP